MMNSTLVEGGAQFAKEELMHRGPGYWREPLFGIFPVSLLVTVVTVILVTLIFWWLLRGSQKNSDTPMNLLKKRYVAGEIDRKTYHQMKEDIAD